MAALTGCECCGRGRLRLLLGPWGWGGDCTCCWPLGGTLCLPLGPWVRGRETVPPAGPLGGFASPAWWGAPSALLCCTGCVLSAWFGVVVLVPFFFPVTTVQEFPCPHGPISTSSRFPWSFQSPVNVYIVSHSVSACLHHHAQCAPRPGLPHVDPLGEALPPLCSLSLADLVILYRTVCIMVLGLGGSDPLGPSCSLQLV